MKLTKTTRRVILLVIAVAIWAVAAYLYVERNKQKDEASRDILSMLHALERSDIEAPLDEGRGGGFAAWDDDIILMNSDGSFHWLAAGGEAFEPLALPPVLDFMAARDVMTTDQFDHFVGTEDLVMREIAPSRWEVYVSHFNPHVDLGCFTLALSRLEFTGSDGQVDVTAPWQQLYETNPCLTPRGNPGQLGGSMAFLDDDRLLLGVGEAHYDIVSLGTDGREVPENLVAIDLETGERNYDGSFIDPQSDAVDYGKTIVLDLKSGAARHYSKGHRNPSGMAIGPSGEPVMIEHGPRGGDEINVIRDNEDYGWPRETFGTNYAAFKWPPAEETGRHDRYAQPQFAFPPGTAPSGLLRLEGRGFPAWRGDFLFGSLYGRIFRLRLKSDLSVVMAEAFFVGTRVRDVIEASNGDLLIKPDGEARVIRLTRDLAAENETMPEVLAACAQCHEWRHVSPSGAPPLITTYWRNVAEIDGASYSDALRQKGGKWNEKRLRQFLRDPQSFAPGSTMPDPGLSDEEIDAVIEALK
ncbi:PQQ-dependent sugar dehydrogenase [Sphingomicrobium arenosum]|uniref:PQQ-dependent sugar dehydrogenase n=1 Tax=Sphingomicrobium arenosum TaxID=2233861 RepID=UPI0022401465|nr:PQQ-dependent sugar dehydrogenase [Sphingomicrobium arenosum]